MSKWRNMTMSEYGFTKKDWVLFREKIADWQEAYMDKLNKEYIELLNGEGTPSEKFSLQLTVSLLYRKLDLGII